eukprot:CAMPEP_0201592372 /NCGR_PEP_ID=MMETSP0190_2-20130828/190290_1 /ASSEMBLY_ACC=CAM_ASM_000263 /TAXON_ID=37353 /ORGANISM="Rosalina sp." /LENGTH=410 /DNA_ID=CAMNT_0048051123 /DNA_START=85 /DNA_END=1317 /DNA_ORIENTATION=+
MLNANNKGSKRSIKSNINNNTNNNHVHVTAYWEGYTEQDCSFPLNEIPLNVDYIPIAFIQPVKDPKSSSKLATTWAFDDQFVYSKEQIRGWIKEINNRGTNQKVLLSIMDTPDVHWYPDVDIDAFAQNIAASCSEWGIAGIDVDAESGMSDPQQEYVKTFVNLIKSLRKYLASDKIISYTCYTESSYDSDIIGQCKDDIDYINTMAYWNNTDGQISLYNHYVNDIGDPNKVGIGVKAGNGGDSTTLQTVEECAQWFRDNDKITEKRMMLWSLTRDVKPITNVDDLTFLDTIHQNIVPNTNCCDNNKDNNNAILKRDIIEHIISFMEVQNIETDTYSNMTKDVETFEIGEKDNSFDGTIADVDAHSGFGDILGGIEEDEWTYVNNGDNSNGFMKVVETNTLNQQQPPCIIL